MGCGKLDLHKKTQDWGLDGKRLVKEWGFSDAIDNAGKHDAINSGRKAPRDPYMAYLENRGLRLAHIEDFEIRGKKGNYAYTAPTPLPDEAYCDNWVAENGLQLLRSAPTGKPWHLVVNFTGPHVPMDITKSMDRSCRDRQFPQPHAGQQFDAATHTAIRQNYSAMVENIDRWLGVYVAELRKRGELDRTVIVYSSDHGEMLGDHGLWGKSLPHEASVRVPLAMAGPGVKPSGTSDALVYVHDLAATFLDMAGVRDRPPAMTSKSLVPLLEGRTRSHREFLRSGLKEWRAVTDGRYKLVRGYKGGTSRLFDLREDPWEDKDVAADRPQELRRLEEKLS
jgi:arylsulfatase A-like enzyme